MIDYKQLVVGKVYFQQAKMDLELFYITLFTGDDKEQFIDLSDKTFETEGCTQGAAINTLREATNYEKRWLKECIKEGMYVPKPKLKVIDFIEGLRY